MHNGIPSKTLVLETIETQTFREQKQFNDQFLLENDQALTYYKEKWVKNPLWQWSRMYEYPFVEEAIHQHLVGKADVSLLDAGSGVTFLPYKLAQHHVIGEIHCLDYDENLLEIYEKIRHPKISFQHGFLDQLPYQADHFDIVYCISVLEHTDNYDQILREFMRVLKDQGLLVITFDIGLRMGHRLNVEQSKKLLAMIQKHVNHSEAEFQAIDLGIKNAWTTQDGRKLDKQLLPIPKRRLVKKIKNFLKGKKGFPDMTFYTLAAKVNK
ncbi:MAG: class I SAM-dependent methyltransferase [Flammeovirgaceae bacterium]